MNQTPLFFDDIDGALRHCVAVLGGPKKVGPMLRGEEMPVDASSRWVSDCLNPDRPAQFHPHQVMVMLRSARALGDHTTMNWLAGECGYDAIPITKAQEVDRLTSAMEQSAKTLASVMAQLERIQLDRAQAGKVTTLSRQA